MQDLELLRAWGDGDAAAGQELVRRHYASIYAFFLGKVERQLAEDLTQQTFEVLCRRRDEFRGDSAVRTFLFGIARNKLVRHFERRKSDRARFDPRGDPPPEVGLPGTLTSLFAARDREMLVVQALRRLPLDDQLLLELKDYEGLTARALAQILGVPPGTVASRLHRARGRLRKEVRRLSARPELVERTLTDLDGAMRAIRDRLLGGAG